MTTKDTPSSSDSRAASKKKSVTDAVVDMLTEFVYNPTPKPREEKLAKLTNEQQQQLHQIEEDAIANFSGQLDELESALGMLRMGHHFGWKVLYLMHSKRTIRKYEGILGDIRIRDIFPEKGPSSYRSFGLAIAEKFSNFWKVAGGDIKIPDRKKVDS